MAQHKNEGAFHSATEKCKKNNGKHQNPGGLQTNEKLARRSFAFVFLWHTSFEVTELAEPGARSAAPNHELEALGPTKILKLPDALAEPGAQS